MRGAGRRRGAALLITVALGLAVLATGPSAAGSDPVAPGTVATPEACPGGLIAIPSSEPDGPPMCTHGPDPGVTAADLAAQGGATPEASAGIQCYGNGTGGERVQLVYAYTGTNRINSFRSRILDRAADINAIYDASAQQTGGHRYVRWVTDAACNLDIQVVNISTAAVPVSAFTTLLIPRLKALGLTSNNRKYLVWVDTGTTIDRPGSVTCSGVGTLYADERPDPAENFNNTLSGYTRVDDTCLFSVFDLVGGKVEAHELMHTLGAVQGRYELPSGQVWTSGSPHHTSYGHCTDDYDIMCYVDGPGTALLSPRPCASSSNEMRFDCNHDDYFSTAPAPGSYLARNWNTANSSWLESEPGAPQPPDPPTGLTAAPGENQVTLSWVKPNFTGGADVIGYRIYRDDVALTAPAITTTSGLVTTTTFTDANAVNGQIHDYQVAAVNSVGEGTRSSAVSALAGVPRPDAQLAAARTGPFSFGDVYAASMTGNTQVLRTTASVGGSSTSYLRIENDRPGIDSFKVKGVGSGSGYTVRYFRGTTEVTPAVVAGSYTVENVPAGGHVDLKVKVTVTSTAARGSSRAVTVTVKSKTVSTTKDVVQVVVARS